MARKSLREKFEESYTAIPVPAKNRKGYTMRYFYYAPWYIWDLPEEKLRKEKWLLLGISLIGLLVFLLSGLTPNEVNGTQLLFIPSALTLCCHILELSGLLQFLAAKYRTTKMTYQTVRDILEYVPWVRMMLMAVSTAVCLYHMAAGGVNGDLVTVAAGYLFCAVTAWLEVSRFRSISVRQEENNALEEADKWLERQDMLK